MYRASASIATLIAVLSGASEVAAQVVHGRIVEAGAPVPGVHVLLLDAQGRRIASVLSGPDGRVIFQVANAGGRYSIVAEMIGRQSTTVGPYTVREGAIEHVIALNPEPVRLEALKAEPARRCRPRPLPGHETHTVWEEARKALAVEEMSRRSLRYQYEIRSFVRELDASASRVVQEENQHRRTYSGVPFRARSADLLIANGWVERDAQGSILYGPTAELLLSDAFLDLYCFHLVRNDRRPGQIGLAFQPFRGRTVPDITGVLWLEEATAELRVLEFGYVGLQRDLPSNDRGGRVTYARLPTGAWFIEEWAIRSPLMTLQTDAFSGQYVETQRIGGYREDGAQVLRIVGTDGAVLYQRQHDGASTPPVRQAP